MPPLSFRPCPQEKRLSLSDEQVRHVARLARLGLTDDEVATFGEQLAEIFEFAEQVGEVATAEVPPTSHPLRPSNVLRDDEPVDGLTHEEAVSTAPRVEDGRFQVPRIAGEDPTGEDPSGEEAAKLPPEGGDPSGEEAAE